MDMTTVYLSKFSAKNDFFKFLPIFYRATFEKGSEFWGDMCCMLNGGNTHGSNETIVMSAVARGTSHSPREVFHGTTVAAVSAAASALRPSRTMKRTPPVVWAKFQLPDHDQRLSVAPPA